MEYLKQILVPLGLFTMIAIIVIAILNFILKMRIVKSGLSDASYIKSLTGSSDSKSGSLKWGLLLFFGGIGLVINEFIPSNGFNSVLPFGIEAIFLSAGFIVYYIVLRNDKSL